MTSYFIKYKWIYILIIIISASMSIEAASCWSLIKKSEAWYLSAEARKSAENVISWQTDIGSWPKNIDTSSRPFSGDRTSLKGIFDNGATTGELRFLARMIMAVKENAWLESFNKGLDLLLKAQYPNGGWPQTYPPPKSGYARHITFNDGTMVKIMELMRDVANNEQFQFVDQERRNAAQKAFQKGIECILHCQISVKGKLTVWCAQHDAIDFKPQPARSYELISLSGAESVDIVRLLMSLDHPNEEIHTAIQAAIAWFEASKIQGIRVELQPDEKSPKGKNKVVLKDPNAPPLWARFYEIESHRPFFCDRDGIKKYSIAEIGYERRNGYAWYVNSPQNLLAKDYPEWEQKRPRSSSAR